MANWSTDTDLKKTEPEIAEYFPPGESDFDKQHADAQEQILRDLINDRTIPMDKDDGLTEAEARVLKVEEMALISRWKTLEIIFGFLSTDPEDKWGMKEAKYRGYYESEYDRIKNALTIDLDNDGAVDEGESKAQHPMIFRRL